MTSKRRKTSTNGSEPSTQATIAGSESSIDEASTDLKLALLASLHPCSDQSELLEALITHNGSVEAASQALTATQTSSAPSTPQKSKRPFAATIGYQSSLSSYAIQQVNVPKSRKALTRKGQTLHLYSPEDVEDHTPCSIIHNFLPSDEATSLLKELLNEAETFSRNKFKVFDNVVESPHTACFYVANEEEEREQKTRYLYNGEYLKDVRHLTTEMRKVSSKVQTAVNAEIKRRIETKYPDGRKLKFQSAKEWVPNTAFANCYNGGGENVGYHCDQLTYLGPRPVIGSISLGVAREFRVRRVVARDEKEDEKQKSPQKSRPDRDDERADAEGQISIHLPHNSLLVMHAEMQEEWKHSIAPAQAIDPHPVSGQKRINITYRCYRDSLDPRYTPRCRCGVACVLRCVQRKKENRGRYMWMCDAGVTPGRNGCSFFEWAQFDEDGEPIWGKRQPEKV